MKRDAMFLLGKKGEAIKRVGADARKALMDTFLCDISLKLHINAPPRDETGTKGAPQRIDTGTKGAPSRDDTGVKGAWERIDTGAKRGPPRGVTDTIRTDRKPNRPLR